VNIVTDRLVSAEEAVKALEDWIDGQPDNSNFGIKSDVIEIAQEIIRSLPAVPQEEDPEAIHTATLTVSSDYLSSRWKFTCHAKVGAPCRMACGIRECEGNCDHNALIDQGECMQVLWLENDDALDECQAGGDFVAWEGPVQVAWNNKNASEYYEFTPLAAAPLPQPDKEN
jgi:hypothetical protein